MDLVEYQSGCRSRHPWELSRFELFLRLLKKSGSLQNGPVEVLDIGSGDAWFAAQLTKHLPHGSTITCWDKGYSDQKIRDEIARANQANLNYEASQPEKKFDVLLAMDVLEHVENDREFLKSIVEQNMKPGATLLISVPAWQRLYSVHDELLSHFRRYSPSAIKQVLRSADLKIRSRGTIFTSLLIFRIFELIKIKLLPNKQTAKIENWSAGPRVTRLIQRVLQADGSMGFLFASLGIDFLGLSWWAICKK